MGGGGCLERAPFFLRKVGSFLLFFFFADFGSVVIFISYFRPPVSFQRCNIAALIHSPKMAICLQVEAASVISQVESYSSRGKESFMQRRR